VRPLDISRTFRGVAPLDALRPRHRGLATVASLTLLSAFAPAHAHDIRSGLSALNQLCRSTIDRADYDEAQRVCKRINFDAEKMAPGSPEHIASVLNMGDIKARVENFVDADAYYASALQLVERAEGPQSEAAARILSSLIEFKVRRGKYLDAVVLAKRMLAIREKVPGPPDLNVAITRARYADLLSQSHQFPEAEAQYKRAIAVLETAGTPEVYARSVQRFGEMYERRAQFKQAEQQYRRLVSIVEGSALGYRLLAGAYDRLAYVCEQQDKVSEAAAFYRKAMATLQGTSAPPEVVARIQAQLAALGAEPARGTR
jgi:tetratricopeptide (TPR) repeat protein